MFFSDSNAETDDLLWTLPLKISSDHLEQLTSYRSTFKDSLKFVIDKIRELGLSIASGRIKTNVSIITKLIREKSIRLSQIQDIVGCRIVVDTIATQNSVVDLLKNNFDVSVIDDRRAMPNHGYRSVHLIVSVDGKLVEIQIRTIYQDSWAQFSEKLSDLIGLNIKYGSGDKKICELLEKLSLWIKKLEEEKEEKLLQTILSEIHQTYIEICSYIKIR
ncbi:MAG: hypothetical protein HQK50_19145 [Oligoflexia bacterium]|nr:hypothetical protein [Oligoflexia bacterium]MBF0367695.1 hypothetical protein [Oligoflexia bacterium]